MLGFEARYVFALLVVALMLGGLYVVVRALGRGRLVTSMGRRLVTVIESTPVAQNTSLHVVKVAGRYYLVGGGSGHLSTLAEVPAEDVDPWLTEQRTLFAEQTRTLGGWLELIKRKSP